MSTTKPIHTYTELLQANVSDVMAALCNANQGSEFNLIEYFAFADTPVREFITTPPSEGLNPYVALSAMHFHKSSSTPPTVSNIKDVAGFVKELEKASKWTQENVPSSALLNNGMNLLQKAGELAKHLQEVAQFHEVHPTIKNIGRNERAWLDQRLAKINALCGLSISIEDPAQTNETPQTTVAGAKTKEDVPLNQLLTTAQKKVQADLGTVMLNAVAADIGTELFKRISAYEMERTRREMHLDTKEFAR